MSMAASTADLGGFASCLTLPAIPAEALAVAKTGCTGCFGVMVPCARALAQGIEPDAASHRALLALAVAP